VLGKETDVEESMGKEDGTKKRDTRRNQQTGQMPSLRI